MATRVVVLSPDGIPIRPQPFASVLQAKAGLASWCQRFEAQGYYAAASGERIPLADLPLRCTIRLPRNTKGD